MMNMKLLDVKNPFGAPVYHEETVSSTMDKARILAGAVHGTVICADFQETGRGRLSRTWLTGRAESLMFTILLRYGDIESIPKAITLRTGLAVSLAIEDLAPALTGSVLVKWPNDVMIADFKSAAARKAEAARKAAGILTETDGNYVFIGVGVNVLQREFPEEFRSKAVSIIEAFPGLVGEWVTSENARFILLEKILSRLHEEIEHPRKSWREALPERLYKKGESVVFAEGAPDSNKLTRGILSGIGPEGELLIIPEGEEKERAFITGELRVY